MILYRHFVDTGVHYVATRGANNGAFMDYSLYYKRLHVTYAYACMSPPRTCRFPTRAHSRTTEVMAVIWRDKPRRRPA